MNKNLSKSLKIFPVAHDFFTNPSSLPHQVFGINEDVISKPHTLVEKASLMPGGAVLLALCKILACAACLLLVKRSKKIKLETRLKHRNLTHTTPLLSDLLSVLRPL